MRGRFLKKSAVTALFVFAMLGGYCCHVSFLVRHKEAAGLLAGKVATRSMPRAWVAHCYEKGSPCGATAVTFMPLGALTIFSGMSPPAPTPSPSSPPSPPPSPPPLPPLPPEPFCETKSSSKNVTRFGLASGSLLKEVVAGHVFRARFGLAIRARFGLAKRVRFGLQNGPGGSQKTSPGGPIFGLD